MESDIQKESIGLIKFLHVKARGTGHEAEAKEAAKAIFRHCLRLKQAPFFEEK